MAIDDQAWSNISEYLAAAPRSEEQLYNALHDKFWSAPSLRTILLNTQNSTLRCTEVSALNSGLGDLLMRVRADIREELLSTGRLHCSQCPLSDQFHMRTEAHLHLHLELNHPPSLFRCWACQKHLLPNRFNVDQLSLIHGHPRKCIRCTGRRSESFRGDLFCPSGSCVYTQEQIHWNGSPALMRMGDILPCAGPGVHAAHPLSTDQRWICSDCDCCSACTYPLFTHAMTPPKDYGEISH
jgi:hypothetical protein